MSTIPKLNWTAQPESELRGHMKLAVSTPPTGLPRVVDLSLGWGDIPNQGNVGACVAFGSTAAMEYVGRTNSITNSNLSKLSQRFLYYVSRVDVDHQDPSADTGTYISTAITALKNYGAAPAALWPYADGSGNIQYWKKPSPEAYEAAMNCQVVRATRVATDTDSLRAALAASAPVILGFTCYPNLYDEDVRSTGIIKMPPPGASNIGGHCVLFVGYDDNKRLFKFRNSWGPEFGKSNSPGYGFLPYDYVERADGWSIWEVENDGIAIEVLKKSAAKFGLQRVSSGPKPTPTPTGPTPTPTPTGPTPTPTPTVAGQFSMGSVAVGAKLSMIKLSGLKADNATYVATDVQTGYATTGSVGARVQRGTSAKLTFEMTLKAVTTSDIMDLDSSLTENMSEDERETYSKAKQEYGGGFNVPLLSWFGINANASYSKEDVESARQANSHYDRQAKDVSQALSQKTEQVITVKGELTATGVSFIPTEVSAYIKVAQIKLSNGTTLNVINTNTPDGLQAADADGKAVPTTGQKLQKITLGRNRLGASDEGGVARGSQVVVGQHLDEGEYITSPDGRFSLCMQKDGNLVLYDGVLTGRALWASNTYRQSTAMPYYVEFQADGNLVMYKANRTTVWASNTSSFEEEARPVVGRLLDDGNFALYDMYGGVRWQTGTGGL